MIGQPNPKENAPDLEDRFFYWRSWINEQNHFNNREDERERLSLKGWHKRQNPPAFKIGNDFWRIMDPFHDLQQYQNLDRKGLLPSFRSISQLLEMINNFEGTITGGKPEQVLNEFADKNFILALIQVRKQEKRKREVQNKIGVSKEKRLAKLKLLQLLLPMLIQFKSAPKLTQRNLIHSLGIPLSFLRLGFDFIEHDLRYLNEIASLEKELNHAKIQNRNFLHFFNRYQLKLRTRRELFQGFKENEQSMKIASLTDFDRKLLRTNRISFQKCKLIYGRKRMKERTICRVHFIEKLLETYEAGHSLLFFDETSFELFSTASYAYGYIGERPLVPFNPRPVFLHVLLISSLSRIEAYLMSFRRVGSEEVATFLHEFLKEKACETDFMNCPIAIIMDNGPKNRSAAVKNLACTKRVSIFYTVPCSPFLNQVETVFNLLKRSVQRHPDYPFQYVNLETAQAGCCKLFLRKFENLGRTNYTNAKKSLHTNFENLFLKIRKVSRVIKIVNMDSFERMRN